MISFGLKRIIKLYKNGSVCICGQRGMGKDLLQGNVAVRLGTYISNIDYGGDYIPLDITALDVHNGYKELLSKNITPYFYPYPEKAYIFLSDIGVHLPCQYNDKLNREYPYLPTFLALSRQLTNGASLNWNSQDLRRCWDKFREQSDTYIMARGVFKPLIKLGLVIQRVRVYELYESAVRRVPPFRLPKPKFTASKEVKQAYEIEKERYYQTYGHVDDILLIYRHKSTYDTNYFKTLLEGQNCNVVLEATTEEET